MRCDDKLGGMPTLEETALRSRRDPQSGLLIEVLRVPPGCAHRSRSGDTLRVHYNGTLDNGDQFDSNHGRGAFGFILGSGQVIGGWEDGLQGMCVGERRRLTVPPALAYGDRGNRAVPGKATLTFTVQLEGMRRDRQEL